MGKIGNTIRHELRSFVPAFLFFLVFFHMLALTRAVVSDDMQLTALRASAATVGAFLVAKSILLVDALPLARWFSGSLIFNILWRTVLFGLVVLAFRLLEESVASYLHEGQVKGIGDFFAQALSPQVLIEVGWIFVGLLGFCLIAEYCRLLGGHLVWKVMTNPRIERDESGQWHPHGRAR